MNHNRRVWTDRRDGTRWTVRAFWIPDELMMGQLVFESTGESFATWWVSNRAVVRLDDPELELLLDEARAR